MNKKRTVFLLLRKMNAGGVQRVAINLAESLKQRAIEPLLVVRYSEGEFWSLVPSDIETVCLNTHSRIRGLFGVARLLRERAPEVLITSGIDALIAIAARALTGASTKIIVGQHGPFRRGIQPPFVGLKHWIYRKVLASGDAFVAVSQGVATAMVTEIGIPRSKILMIYNPVIDSEHEVRAAESVDHPFFAPGSPPVFVGVGRLVEQKDFATLLAAFAVYRRKQPGRLLIIGDGPLRSELEKQSAKLAIEKDVDFIGTCLNPAAYMARATALVNTSIHGGFENVLVEALAVGTRVICTDCEFGPAEAIDGGRFGALVPVGDVEAIAMAMSDAADRPGPRDGQIDFAEKFSVENSAQQYLKLIDELCR